MARRRARPSRTSISSAMERLLARRARREARPERARSSAPRSRRRHRSRCTRPTSPTSSRACRSRSASCVWGLVRSDRDGEILLEVSDAVRETLLADMDSAEIVAATQQPRGRRDRRPRPRPAGGGGAGHHRGAGRRRTAPSCSRRCRIPEGTVGALMDFEVVSIRDDVTVEVALRYLRRFDELPSQTDAVFVVDRDDHLKGVLPLKTPAGDRSRRRGRRPLRPRRGHVHPRGRRRRGRRGLRALRPGVRAGGRRRGQA